MPVARQLFNLSEMGMGVAQRMNGRRITEYSKSISIFRVFIPRASTRPLEMGLPRTSWVKLNRLCTGVRRFLSSM